MDAMTRYAARRAAELGMPPVKTLLHGTIPGWLAPAPENIEAARAFLLDKWYDRAREQGCAEPAGLDSACIFGSVFAQCVFGGRLRGNWDHQAVEHPVVGTIDLTRRSSAIRHDPTFWGRAEHREKVTSVLPRVARWVAEFEDLTASKKRRRTRR